MIIAKIPRTLNRTCLKLISDIFFKLPTTCSYNAALRSRFGLKIVKSCDCPPARIFRSGKSEAMSVMRCYILARHVQLRTSSSEVSFFYPFEWKSEIVEVRILVRALIANRLSKISFFIQLWIPRWYESKSFLLLVKSAQRSARSVRLVSDPRCQIRFIAQRFYRSACI